MMIVNMPYTLYIENLRVKSLSVCGIYLKLEQW